MRRISSVLLLASCTLFLSANSSSIDGRTASDVAQTKDHSGPWKALKNGAQVLRVWETEGSPDWPQVAVVRMPETEFAKFEANSKDYVNDQKIFPVAVNSVSVKGGCCPPLKGGDRLVVLMHCHDSSTCSICTGSK